MRVSVVVPVFDPGRYIEDLITSLQAQTLDPSEFEVVLVDDGSTDATPALLDALAASDARFRVIHTPNSGWPGRPRNLGIDAARGDYVFLSDHDDRLHPEALQRLTDFAIEHGSDVVAGRVIGVGRSAPERIFARTVVDAQQDPGLLVTSLTPQKLYRRAFLQEQDIRFPEGRRRLEDHLFVTKAYLRARRVSVYADSPVYYFVLRDDGRNASRTPVEWHGYFANAAESIAVVDAEAPDEATRLVMRARWLRVEAIGRLRGRRFLGQKDREGLLDATQRLLQEHYAVAEVDRLGPADRLVGRLLLDGRTEDVAAFAAWEAAIGVHVQVDEAALRPDALVLALRAETTAAYPLPAALAALPEGYPDRSAIERTGRLPGSASVTAQLRGPGGTVVELATDAAVVEGVLSATARGGLAPMSEGVWRLRTAVRGAGLPAAETPHAASVDPQRVRSAERRFALAIDGKHRLVVTVERSGLLPAVDRAAHRLRSGLGWRLRGR